MAAEYEDRVALARQLRQDIEALEGEAAVRNNYNEFRRRLKAAGLTITAAEASQLWRESAAEPEEAADSDEDAAEGEQVDDPPLPAGGVGVASPTDGQEQGLSLVELQSGLDEIRLD